MLPPRIAPYRLAGGVFAVAALLYFSFPAARFNFDGVAAAIAVELGDFKHLLHGNHLAYGFLGYLFNGVFRIFGISLPAIYTLQIFSSLLGAAAAALFALLLLECEIDPVIAGLSAVGLAVSKIFWVWSLEAQVYPLGAFFLFWTAYEIFRPDPKPARAGLLHAGAILGHVGHLMFLPAALYLLRNRKSRLRYCAALGAGVLIAYAAAAVFVVQPQSWDECKVWLLGSAALNVEKKFQWIGGYSFGGVMDWIRVTLNLTGLGIAGSLALIAASAAEAAMEKKSRTVRACLLWIAGYAVLYLAWQPHTAVYRITDLAPLWMLTALAMKRVPWKREMKFIALACGVALLGGWNFIHEILPGSNPYRNMDLQRALWVAKETPENAWIVVEGTDQVYVPYFAHRRPLNLRYYENRQIELLRRIEGIGKSGDPVFVVPQAVSEPWQPALTKHSSLTAHIGRWELRRFGGFRARSIPGKS